MKVVGTHLNGVVLLEPTVFRDARGFFLETYNEKKMAAAGIQERFVQDNHSHSPRNVLRGLHYQISHPQGKLVRAVGGEIFDVAVDLRRKSPTFGQWYGTVLSGENNQILWVPAGFAHGFSVLSENADVMYKTTDFYYPEFERTLAWDDSELRIHWPSKDQAIVSAKDALGASLKDCETFG